VVKAIEGWPIERVVRTATLAKAQRCTLTEVQKMQHAQAQHQMSVAENSFWYNGDRAQSRCQDGEVGKAKNGW
jgi:hypothetical protein